MNQQELIAIIRSHFLVLIISPLFVILATYLLLGLLPPTYTSLAYLRIDRPTARSMEAIMTSPAIADNVLSGKPGTGDTPESRVKYLSRNLRIFDVEPQADSNSVRLFRVGLTSEDPLAAQQINSELIDAWIKTTLPGPIKRGRLEAEIARYLEMEKTTDRLINKLQSEASTLILPNSLPGELATPIYSLIEKRDASISAINDMRIQLTGLSRDIIVIPPHLPGDPSGPKKAIISVLAGLAAIPLFLALVLFGRFLAPGRSLWSRRA